jgi:hypothetical protein
MPFVAPGGGFQSALHLVVRIEQRLDFAWICGVNGS